MAAQIMRNKKLCPYWLFVIVACVGYPTDSWSADARSGQLIVFVQPEKSTVAKIFEQQHLPDIQKIASQMNIPVRVVDASHGSPSEITITPLLVYQNELGRSIYQGRFTTTDRIRNFLRTASMVPQGDESLTRTHIPIWRTGRTTIASPIKIAPVTGSTPTNYVHEQFTSEMIRAIQKGFKHYQFTDSVSLERSDRMFYMDFNPWLSPDGTLYLSVTLFSQFHCKEHVFVQSGEQIHGPWRKRSTLFAQAAAVLDQAVIENIASATNGDGFDLIAENNPAVSWASLGLEIKKGANDASRSRTMNSLQMKNYQLPRHWVMEEAQLGSPPRLQFTFPAPLDIYSGEATKIIGQLELQNATNLSTARGLFEVNPRSVTMGDPDLDHTLYDDADYLHVAKYASSKFTLESIDVEPGLFRYGELLQGTMHGQFEMKGVKTPLSVRTEFEPVLSEQGQPRLLMRGSFEIRLQPFNIAQPDGPTPANDTLLFHFRWSMKKR